MFEKASPVSTRKGNAIIDKGIDASEVKLLLFRSSEAANAWLHSVKTLKRHSLFKVPSMMGRRREKQLQFIHVLA